MQTHCEWQDCPRAVLVVFQYEPGECAISLCMIHGFRLIDVYPDGVIRELAYTLR